MKISQAFSFQENFTSFGLIKEVFEEFVATGYSEEGVETFWKLVTPQFMESLAERNGFVLNATEENEIAGTIAVRDGSHICLFFVKKKFQGRGIGKALFKEAEKIIRNGGARKISVHSSPYAETIYRALGFNATGPELVEMGIRYVPMEMDL